MGLRGTLAQLITKSDSAHKIILRIARQDAAGDKVDIDELNTLMISANMKHKDYENIVLALTRIRELEGCESKLNECERNEAIAQKAINDWKEEGIQIELRRKAEMVELFSSFAAAQSALKETIDRVGELNKLRHDYAELFESLPLNYDQYILCTRNSISRHYPSSAKRIYVDETTFNHEENKRNKIMTDVVNAVREKYQRSKSTKPFVMPTWDDALREIGAMNQ